MGDVLSDIMRMFGPVSQKDRAFEEALYIIDCDDESEDSTYACERIIKSAWDHAARMADNPAGVARSLPWDALADTESDRGGGYIDKLIQESITLWDSDLGYGSADEKSDGDEEGEDKPTRLTGEQLYKDHYVDRFLPGVVDPHPHDNRPTNAIAWNTTVDYNCDNYGEWENYKELARTHPGDDIRDHEKFSQKNSSARGYCGKDFCPIVTKAGSRLWSISIAAAAPQSDQDAPCIDMKAAYPGQLTIRYDLGRDLLIYDMFEFKPMTVNSFSNLYSSDEGSGICTEAEVAEVEKLIRSTRRKRPVRGRECLSSESTVQERIDAIGPEKFLHLLNYIRFKKSKLMRIRFPLTGLRGVRVLELEYQRPNRDLSPPSGVHPTSRLGEEGEMGEPEGHNTFECCDDKLENLGMLVLEYGDFPLSFNETSIGVKNKGVIPNRHPFSSTVLWPKDWRDRKRNPVDHDWTPDQIFSKSRRHYIVGDLSEILELSNFLMSRSSKVANMLSLPDGDSHVSAKKLLNSLSGSVSILNLNETPSDVFADMVEVGNSSSASATSTLKDLCVESLVGSSRLKMPQKREQRQFESKKAVHEFLEKCGIDRPQSVNACLKAGLLNGKLVVPHELLHATDPSSWLGTTLLTEKCTSPCCGGTRTCTIKDVLYQDHRGSEEIRDCQRTAAHCGGIFCQGLFVAGMCEGLLRFAGRNHNHCTKCPDFGCCVGYYENLHCDQCGSHYISGQKCEGCAYTKTKASLKSEETDDTKPAPSSWNGLISGCSRLDVVEGERKEALVKELREKLVIVAIIGRNNMEGLETLLSSALPPDTAKEIAAEGCHTKLDKKTYPELLQIKECIINILRNDNA